MATSVPLVSAASIPLPPGYKFNPTDEEIILCYLRCRSVNQPLPSAFITDKDILNHNPWELVPEGTSEKYFFHCRVMRWAASSRWKRCTKDGFWKASGKEIPIFCRSVRNMIQILIGLKRTQVFYLGKAPAGQRTDWVMEEYSLTGAGLGPYDVVVPSTNQNIPQRDCIVDVVGKEHNDTADPLQGTDPSIKSTPVMLHPDRSWVVCRIHKRTKPAPHIVVGSSSSREEKIRFFDFLGLGNPHQSTVTSGTEIEKSEVEGNEGSTEDASTSKGN